MKIARRSVFTHRGKEEEEQQQQQQKRKLKRQLRALNCTHDWKKIGSPPLSQEKKQNYSHKRKLLMYLLCFIKRDKVWPIPPAAPNTATLYFALCDSDDGPTPIVLLEERYLFLYKKVWHFIFFALFEKYEKEQKQRRALSPTSFIPKEEEEDTTDDAGEQQTSSSSSSSTTKGDILFSNVLLPSPPLGVFISVLYAPKRGKKIIVPTRYIGQRRRGKCERRGADPTTPRKRSSNYHCHSSQGTTTATTTTTPDERNADEE